MPSRQEAIEAMGFRVDSNESLFLQEELKAQEARLYRVKFPQILYPTLFPVKSDGPGYKSVSYRVLDEYGVAEFGTPNSATTFVDAAMREIFAKVDIIKKAYRYTYHDQQYAARTNLPLDSELANITKRVIDTGVDKCSILGDTTFKKVGLLTDAASTLTVTTVPADGTGSSALWINKTATQILRDINRLFGDIVTATNGLYPANILLLPPSHLEYIQSLPLFTGTDVTVYSFLIKNRPGLRIYGVPNLKAVSTLSNQDVMVAYQMSEEVLTYKVPVPFMAMPGVYTPDYDYQVTCFADVAGMERKNPKAIAYGAGI